jgi:formate hydrogenlyase subunit 6/NADH:ubiquinone oxidoreductase subunit I
MIRPGKMLLEVLGQATHKPATLDYPAHKVTMPPRFRGRLIYRAELCVGCRLCEKDCPSEAISIVKLEDGRFDAILDSGRCVFCAQCVDSCNKRALEASPEYELATMDKSKLNVRINLD